MSTYTQNHDESSTGFYDVYYNEAGTKFIVLTGLSIDNQVTSSPLQNFMHQHYDSFAVMYSLCLVAVLTYMASLHILIPLLRRRHNRS